MVTGLAAAQVRQGSPEDRIAVARRLLDEIETRLAGVQLTVCSLEGVCPGLQSGIRCSLRRLRRGFLAGTSGRALGGLGVVLFCCLKLKNVI